MSLFEKWHRRHLADDPREPASPPPFEGGERVIMNLPPISGGIGLNDQHGAVIGVVWNPEDPAGPWVLTIRLDRHALVVTASAAEVTREPEHINPPEPPAPHDDEHAEPTPLYDDVTAAAMARDGLAAEVESYLRLVANGGAS